MSLRARRAALVFAAVIVAFVMTIAVDRAASWVIPEKESVVFPANSRFELRTPEFTYAANVNSLGFRGPDPSQRDRGEPLVLAIGDSSTYGWGVTDAEAWPQVLEKALRAQGIAVRVANLGRPGAGPDQYARIAEQAVPLLKPRWVVVGLLQGDDLNQAVVPGKHEDDPHDASILETLYPTLTDLRSELASPKQPTVIPAERAAAEWRTKATELLERLRPVERARFDALPADVRARFRRGQLNPYVVELAIRKPHYYSWLLDDASPTVARKVRALAEQLARIRAVGEAYGAKLVVLSIPNWPYVAHAPETTRLGFQLPREMLATRAPDVEAERACAAAGVAHLDVTASIRRDASEGRPLFFPLDGHLNAEGQRRVAAAIEPQMAKLVRSDEIR